MTWNRAQVFIPINETKSNQIETASFRYEFQATTRSVT